MIFLVFVAICASFFINTAKLQKELYQDAKKYAEEINEQVAKNIAYRMHTDMQLVEELAETISAVSDISMYDQILERKRQAFKLDEIIIFNKDTVVFPGNCSMDLFSKWLEENPEASEKSTISHMSRNRILFSVPINKGNPEKEAIILAIKSYYGIQEVMAKENHRHEGISFLMGPEGGLIIDPVGECELAGNEVEHLRKKIAAAFNSRMKDNHMVNQSFTIELQNGGKMLISAHSLDINNWVQVSITPWSLKEKEYSYHLVIYFWLIMLAGIVGTGIVAYIISLQRQARMKLEKIAYSDLLTGGITNDAFQIQCLDYLHAAGWSSYAVVYLNLCDFKYINERWGINGGNDVLRHIHHTFEKNIMEDELVTRSEIDHFFLLLRGDSEEQIRERIVRMIEVLNASSCAYLLDYKLEFIVGGYMIEQYGMVLQSLQDNARRAAQFAEEKNICVFYNAAVIKKIERENKLNDLFEDSLQNHDFQVYLQPKVYIQEDRPCAAEALVRWIHPEEGVIFPSDFIPLFEQNGKICKLDFYMFEEVCKILVRWRNENRPMSEVSVNISREHLKGMDVSFAHRYCEIKEKYEIPDGIIQLEITETSMFYAPQLPCVIEVIGIFHHSGITCALDDFGFGYSSLSALNEFNINTIKLDRSFFVNESKKSRIVVENMIRLAHDMDTQIVAEGIEDEEQVQALRELGCDLIQGYYYSKPIPVSEFEVWQDNHLQGAGK